MKIKEARIEAGLTQKQMSNLLGIPIRTIQNWESGINKCPEYVERLILDQIKLKRYIIIYVENESYIEEYVEAYTVEEALKTLNYINPKQIDEIAVCLQKEGETI